MVVYGSSQRPNTPSRLNEVRWRSIHFWAYARQASITAGRSMVRFLDPSSLSTLSSIGRPWQSQPGTKSAVSPFWLRYLTTMSFRILLSACPMWMSPLA